MAADPLVEVIGLRVARGRFALEVPAWRVPAGAVVGVVGPNGAGKTTLLGVLAGLARPDGGRARVLGHDPWERPELVRAELGYMTDDLPVFDLRVAALLRAVSGYYRSWDPALAAALLERFQVDPAARARDLSKGEGTRLRLVLALAFRPRLVLLDEPASGLDLGGRRALLSSVLEVVRDASRSVVVSSHDLADVERVADELLVLRGGAVIAQGPTDALVGDGRTLEEAMLGWGAA